MRKVIVLKKEINRKEVQEWVKERFELSVERIREIAEANTAEAPFDVYFHCLADFILYVEKVYEMRQDGLRQVSNPSELLLSQDHEGMSGVAIASAIEGIRPFLIETQALVSSAVYGNPQRSATGFDLRRMNMLLAVLEKRVGFKLAQKDVFLNIAGGLKVNDPAIDLSVISAILSSNMDAAIEPEVCMAGEIGLSGEIRPVNRIEQRIGEAEKLGFKRFLLPKYNLQGIDTQKLKIELVPVRKVEEAFRALFG